VRPGRADDFIAAWTEFAEWTSENVQGAGRGTLLRDLDDPNRFVSFGPWESLEAIESWRSLDGWKQRVAQIREMLAGFQPATLELVVEKG
jgi:heme-degrading monooxygenase HmoA